MPRRNYPRALSNHRGFTLIEVVVAFSILALALGVLYESFGWGLRRTNVLGQQESAWLTAQSILAEIRVKPALRVGVESGTAPGGLQWTTTTALHSATGAQQAALKAFEITIEVRWGARGAQQVRLQSIETGRLTS